MLGKRSVQTYLLICLFPVAVGVIGTIVIAIRSPEETEPVGRHPTTQPQTSQPLTRPASGPSNRELPQRKDNEQIRILSRDKQALLKQKEALIRKLVESKEMEAELRTLLDTKDARIVHLTGRLTGLEEANKMLLEELAKVLEQQGEHARAGKLREKLAQMRHRSSRTQPTTAPTTRKDAPLLVK